MSNKKGDYQEELKNYKWGISDHHKDLPPEEFLNEVISNGKEKQSPNPWNDLDSHCEAEEQIHVKSPWFVVEFKTSKFSINSSNPKDFHLQRNTFRCSLCSIIVARKDYVKHFAKRHNITKARRVQACLPYDAVSWYEKRDAARRARQKKKNRNRPNAVSAAKACANNPSTRNRLKQTGVPAPNRPAGMSSSRRRNNKRPMPALEETLLPPAQADPLLTDAHLTCKPPIKRRRDNLSAENMLIEVESPSDLMLSVIGCDIGAAVDTPPSYSPDIRPSTPTPPLAAATEITAYDSVESMAPTLGHGPNSASPSPDIEIEVDNQVNDALDTETENAVASITGGCHSRSSQSHARPGRSTYNDDEWLNTNMSLPDAMFSQTQPHRHKQMGNAAARHNSHARPYAAYERYPPKRSASDDLQVWQPNAPPRKERKDFTMENGYVHPKAVNSDFTDCNEIRVMPNQRRTPNERSVLKSMDTLMTMSNCVAPSATSTSSSVQNCLQNATGQRNYQYNMSRDGDSRSHTIQRFLPSLSRQAASPLNVNDMGMTLLRRSAASAPRQKTVLTSKNDLWHVTKRSQAEMTNFGLRQVPRTQEPEIKGGTMYGGPAQNRVLVVSDREKSIAGKQQKKPACLPVQRDNSHIQYNRAATNMGQVQSPASVIENDRSDRFILVSRPRGQEAEELGAVASYDARSPSVVKQTPLPPPSITHGVSSVVGANNVAIAPAPVQRNQLTPMEIQQLRNGGGLVLPNRPQSAGALSQHSQQQRGPVLNPGAVRRSINTNTAPIHSAVSQTPVARGQSVMNMQQMQRQQQQYYNVQQQQQQQQQIQARQRQQILQQHHLAPRHSPNIGQQSLLNRNLTNRVAVMSANQGASSPSMVGQQMSAGTHSDPVTFTVAQTTGQSGQGQHAISQKLRNQVYVLSRNPNQ